MVLTVCLGVVFLLKSDRGDEIRFTLCVPFHNIIIKVLPKHWLGGVK